MKELINNNFQRDVINSDNPVVLTVSADWCGPCHILHSMLEELEESYGNNVRFYEMNIQENAVISDELGIKYIPTTIIYSGGKALKRIIGVPDKDEIAGVIDSLIYQESENL